MRHIFKISLNKFDYIIITREINWVIHALKFFEVPQIQNIISGLLEGWQTKWISNSSFMEYCKILDHLLKYEVRLCIVVKNRLSSILFISVTRTVKFNNRKYFLILIMINNNLCGNLSLYFDFWYCQKHHFSYKYLGYDLTPRF